jgi:opacity protein-like surface antigen
MKIRGLAWAVVVALVIAGTARAADKPEDLAQAAAESWLKLTDAGHAGASWDQAAKLFKGAVTKEQWTQALAGVRPPLGKVISRKVTSRQYSEKVPGAPDGKHVTIQYETAFENKASAVETITPMLDPDGIWRVSGYFIR